MIDETCFCEDQESKDVPSEDESGVLFYVNKDGFPISKKTWERMWLHVEKIHPKGAQMVHSVRNSQQLAKVLKTIKFKLPNLSSKFPIDLTKLGSGFSVKSFELLSLIIVSRYPASTKLR